MTDQITPAVLYAAKSTADPRGSIGTQLADARRMAEDEGWLVVGEFHDEGFSAYSGNRGPDLERAKQRSTEAAAEYETDAMLVVQHSDRLARGAGDAPDAADHLIEVYFWARRHGVRLRSKQDDSNLEDPIRAMLIGERNTEDSRRKSEAVMAGKNRQFERGEKLGGPVNDGLSLRVERDAADRVVARHYERDPERAPIIERLFDLADEGHSDSSVMRTLNAEGQHTREFVVKSGANKGEVRGGGPWTRRTVQHTILNPIYAGRIVRKTKEGQKLDEPEVIEATNVEGLIDPDRYDAIIAKRTLRDRVAPDRRRRGGRPTARFVLARLGICDRCGSRMYAKSNPYRRKDGTHRRTYVCAHYATATGLCDQKPLDAEKIDRAVISYLDELFVDFDQWQRELSGARDTQREQAEAALDRATKEAKRLDKLADKVRADYLKNLDAGKDGAAEIAAESLAEVRAKVDALTAAAHAHQQTVDEMKQPTDDAMLDAYNSLAAAVRGGEDAGDEVQEINERLKGQFEEFRLDQQDAENVSVLPVLRKQPAPDVAALYAAWEEAGCPEPTEAEVAEWDRISRGQSILVDGRALPADLPARSPALIWATGREELRPPAKELLIGMEQYSQL